MGIIRVRKVLRPSHRAPLGVLIPMKIVCPQCNFSRDIPQDRLPAKAVIATCPRCKHRFRMSASGVDNADASVSPAAPNSPDSAGFSADYRRMDTQGDDPLPPGAIIPRSDDADTKVFETNAPKGSSESAPSQTGAPQARTVRPDSASPEPSFEEQQRIAREAYTRQTFASSEPDGQGRPDGADPYDSSDPADTFALDNPWENPRYGYPAAFYQTAMRVMFTAPRFFAGLEPTPTQWRALAFYLVVGVLQIVIERLWGEVLSSALAPVAGTDPQMQGLLQMLAPETSIAMTVLLRSAMITLELFFAAALYHLVFRLFVPAHANFSLVFQVLAYSSAPALLCIVPVAGSIVGFIWGLACSFIGCRYALRLSLAQTVMSLVPLYLLGIPFIMLLLQGLQSVGG